MANRQSSAVATEMVVSLLIGTSFTLLLSIFRAARILAPLADVLLRPGPYAAGKIDSNRVGNIILSVVGNGIFYGSFPFLMFRVFSRRTRPRNLQPLIERRRAHRVLLAAPVFVYGWLRGEPFSENTETLDVSATGGLMRLSAGVLPSQPLIVINAQSNEELACRATRAIRTSDGKSMIAFEFLHASTNFWQVDFVPGPSKRIAS
jgi:hypothetical protein